MSDIHALSGAYAVNALDDLERARFERHLHDCATCRAEVDDLREASATLAHTLTASAPVALRERVLADVAVTRPLPPVIAAASERREAARRRFPGLIAAAAFIVALGAGAVGIAQPWDDDPTGPSVASTTELVLGAGDAQRISRRLEDGSKATLVYSADHDRSVLVAENMAPPPMGSVYELWYVDREGAMTSAGLMADAGNTSVLLDDEADGATAVGITVEPAGGSEVPTSQPFAVFPIETT